MKTAPFVTLIVCIAMLLTSCSRSNSPENLAQKCIAIADKSIAAEQSPTLGELPSIAERNHAACDSLKKITREMAEEMSQDRADVKAFETLQANADSAKSIINAHYEAEFNKLSQQYIGLEIKTACQESIFSGAKAHISGFRGTGEVEITYTLTTARRMGRYFRLLFVDGANNLLMPYSLMCKPCSAGTTFTGTTMVPISVIKNTVHILCGE